MLNYLCLLGGPQRTSQAPEPDASNAKQVGDEESDPAGHSLRPSSSVEGSQAVEAYSIKSGILLVGGTGKPWTEALRDTHFYISGASYVLARVALNVVAVTTPLYLIYAASFASEASTATPAAIAAVPFCAVVCSLLFSALADARLSTSCANGARAAALACLITTVGSAARSDTAGRPANSCRGAGR